MINLPRNSKKAECQENAGFRDILLFRKVRLCLQNDKWVIFDDKIHLFASSII